MKPETKFKRRVRPELEAIPKSYWEKTQQVSIRGTPDFVGCVRGRSVVIELKVDDNKADALQDYKLSRWRQAGAIAYVMTPENKDRIIQELKELP